MAPLSFWEDPNRVDSFAAKAADHRLVELVKEFPSPKKIKVLDLGCAAGRNTVFLAECGFDVWAVDSSQAMIEKTKSSLASIVETNVINNQIKVGKMDDLAWAKSESFDLLVALGIYHNAQCKEEFEKALKESHRVLKPGGKLLVANFAPGTELPHLNLVKCSDHIWKDEKHKSLYLLNGDELDEKMKVLSFCPVVKTVTVEKGRRVTVNALYAKKV